jgi:hypothetical protein
MVRDSRKGECLWQEWTGEGYEPDDPDYSVIFFTIDHVDVEHEVVRRALASALQREGVADSLGDGYRSIDTATVSCGYAGEVEGSRELHVCDEEGETSYGDLVDSVTEVTWVEV